MPWILNEDGAMKAKFSGLFVTDENTVGTRPVTLVFRMPETELSDMTFPSIVIDPAGISKADDREHRGATNLPYYPEAYVGTVPAETVDVDGVPTDFEPGVDVTLSPFYVDDYPIPYNFDYNITVYSRLQQHTSELLGALAMQQYLPHRFGYLEVPEDGTVRSLDVIGGPATTADRDANGKRVFRTSYIVRVTSELTSFQYKQVLSSGRVQSVNVEMVDFEEQGWES